MSTTLIDYADEFDGHSAMQWGWLWADITGRPRWHLVHTYEGIDFDGDAEDVMVRFINIEDPAHDFEEPAQCYDGAPFVPHMPPGHKASWDGQEGANRRVSIWWGDGSSSHWEWVAGTETGRALASNAEKAVDRLMKLEGDE